eukprot:885564_1
MHVTMTHQTLLLPFKYHRFVHCIFWCKCIAYAHHFIDNDHILFRGISIHLLLYSTPNHTLFAPLDVRYRNVCVIVDVLWCYHTVIGSVECKDSPFCGSMYHRGGNRA